MISVLYDMVERGSSGVVPKPSSHRLRLAVEVLIPTAFWSDSFGIPKPREV